MILYLDASALVKRYVEETGSKEVIRLASAAEAVATSLVSRAEAGAALARAVRLGVLDERGGNLAQRRLSREWPNIARLPVTEALVARAEVLAWDQGLRGYEAVHLAAALTWRDAVSQSVVLATFDRELWEGARRVGLDAWPEKLAAGRA